MAEGTGKGLNHAKGRRQSKNRNKYARQFFITAANKRVAWTRHIANNPNDQQALQVLPLLLAGK